MLSSITRLAGVVTLPRQSHAALSQIEFMPLSDNRVLAILVVNGREVQNRILQLERYYSADELRRASNYLNQEFGGKELSAVREHLVNQLKETRGASESDDARCNPACAAGGEHRRLPAGAWNM